MVRKLIALLGLFFFSPISGAQERCANAYSDIAALDEYLKNESIKYQKGIVDGELVYVIEPGGLSPVNKLALQVKEKMNVDIALFGSNIFRSPDDFSMSAFMYVSDGVKQPVLSISAYSLVNHLKKKDPIFLHELRHHQFDVDLARKKPSPFYGVVIAKEGQLQDSANSSIRPYSTELSFEEMRTYHSQTKQYIEQFKSALKSKDPERIQRSFDFFQGSSQLGFIVSNRARIMCDLLLEAIENKKIVLNFIDQQGIVVASIRNFRVEHGVLDILIPLVKSQGVQDKRNRQLFEEQIASTFQVAEKLTLQYKKILSEALNSVDFKYLDEAQQTLVPFYKSN